MTSVEAKDELTPAVLDAVRCLPTDRQAAILLDTSLALIDSGQYDVSRLFFLSHMPFLTLSHADMDPKSKNFSEFISRPRVYRKKI